MCHIHPAEALWVNGDGDYRVHLFLIKPHNSDPGKKYPLILNVHGGPQSPWRDRYRGDWQVYPAAGYVVRDEAGRLAATAVSHWSASSSSISTPRERADLMIWARAAADAGVGSRVIRRLNCIGIFISHLTKIDLRLSII